MTDGLAVLAVALFAGAALWTATRQRSQPGGDASLTWGLALVATASALRVPALADLVKEVAPAGAHEVTKHAFLATGCVLVAAWARSTTGRRAAPRQVVGAAVAVGGSLVVLVALNGPWTTADFDDQSAGRPWMLAYWAVYYGTFVWATAIFGLAALSTRRGRHVRDRWGTDLVAAGTLVGLVWALVSIVAAVLESTASAGVDTALGTLTRYLVASSSVLITVGLLGHLASAGVDRRRRRKDIEALHAHLVGEVTESRLEGVRPQVAEYHRTIEILDALAVLSRYASPDDAHRVRRIVGDVPEPVVRALQIDVAVHRRGLDLPAEMPATWNEWVPDDETLRRLGRAFREQPAALRRQVLTELLAV